ncbi:hypothetical protein ACFY2Q_26715 [Micromonospora sp. NPDC000316]|uniref:hypothetical protein n=1 Tax=Micromonospora sp. NPDC000316 TaxID=3364216 RepID=UPI0036A1C619
MSGRRLGRLVGSLLLLAAVLGGLSGAGSLAGGKAQLADVVWGASQGDVVWGSAQGDVVWGTSEGDVVWGVEVPR